MSFETSSQEINVDVAHGTDNSPLSVQVAIDGTRAEMVLFNPL